MKGKVTSNSTNCSQFLQQPAVSAKSRDQKIQARGGFAVEQLPQPVEALEEQRAEGEALLKHDRIPAIRDADRERVAALLRRDRSEVSVSVEGRVEEAVLREKPDAFASLRFGDLCLPMEWIVAIFSNDGRHAEQQTVERLVFLACVVSSAAV